MDSGTVWTDVSGQTRDTDASQGRSFGRGGASSQDASAGPYAQPRTRQRVYKAPPPLDVPDINEDAAERKRILNVLAQRRYRERKRNKKKAATAGSTSETSASGERDSPVHSGGTSSSSRPGTEVSLDDFMDAIGPEEALEMCFPDGSLDASPWTASLAIASPLGGEFAGGVPMPGFLLADSPDADAGGGVSLAGEGQAEALQGAYQTGGIDPSSLSVPARDTSSPTDSAPSADSYLLPMNELTVLRAVLRISERLNVPSFWSLDASSPFTTGAAAPLSVPAPWRPTPAQLTMQHHPIIDFMPWPRVRDNLLNVMALPDEARPAGAVGPLALVNFAYDVEDSSEGMRIWGDDIYDPSCWEVGQVLFERWWFLFDREIIENSNRWRRARGASTLRIRDVGSGGSAG